MMEDAPAEPTVPVLDAETAALVRLAAVVTAGSEGQLRRAVAGAVSAIRAEWVEEIILQSYLFAGFPRTLNAAREWRKASGLPAPAADDGTRYEDALDWRASGESTCATVYGPFYTQLRHNIQELHPALDAWMIVDGYGKVLSRPALDLMRRELCIVAACALARQDRQLHSHLHGALHAGATPAQVEAALAAVDDMLDERDAQRYRQLFAKVRRK